ncbi:hypothetical protein LSTR_LSTR003357 [Laodelphax striatellus]|uniref:Peptidase M13 N-terminal domain-containing protein n=1 Tax=Laodelphax striatellus TaxID=195883 RepID=A0A482X4Y7_LAOST|nr:hypothetical protein LSTR_LSTR003357 [Laodelphax striatellus]
MFLQSMDVSVDPCEDFYTYACGNWGNSHVSLEGPLSWFTERTKHLQSRVYDILRDNDSSSDPMPLKYARQLYRSCLDTAQLDKLGVEPIMQVLDRVKLPRVIPSEETVANFSLARTLALAQRVLSMDILVTLSLDVDNSTNLTTINVSPALGFSPLPELELVTAPTRQHSHAQLDPRDILLLKVGYIASVLSELYPVANTSNYNTIAFKILLMESHIKTDADQLNIEDEPERMTFGDLQKIMDEANSTGEPNTRFDWAEYLEVLVENLNLNVTVGLSSIVYVHGTSYFAAMGQRLHKVKTESIQRLIWWKIIDALLPHTTTTLRMLKDDLFRSVFRNSGKPSRQAKCTRIVKTFLNMALSYKIAVEDPLHEVIHRVRGMLKDIISAFKSLVGELKWMDAFTKIATLNKVDAIKSYIGYPEWLLDNGELEKFYDGVEVVEGEFLQSMLNMKAVEVAALLKTIGSLPDTNPKYSWVSDPIEVNAYYSRNLNAISIPAGILQIPFYFLGLEALNYGAIGSILGHEVTHGFDVEGKDFDASGKKVTWWSDHMLVEYNKRTECFINQYNNYTLGANNVNGTHTLAENIADNGGVREALRAYRIFMNRRGPEKSIPGFQNFTHEQLLFLSFAHVWCQTTTPESDILTLTDVHSPSKYRVLGSLVNLPEFSEVWGCKPKSPMNPVSKCILW